MKNHNVNTDLIRSIPHIAKLLEHRNDVYVHHGTICLRLRHGVFIGGQLTVISRALTGKVDSFLVYTYDYELVLSIKLDDLLPVFFM